MPEVPALEVDAASPGPRAAPSPQPAPSRSAPLLAYSRSRGAAPSELAAHRERPEAPRFVSELDELRRGSALGRARATRLGDRNFLILAGATLPCVLQTAMDSATPGYVSCLVPRDVYSDNGAVVLLEKGTKVLGEYRASLRQGQNRLFVLWTRAVTPAGVAIALASPAADGLGRAGFGGTIDTHFWERFGGAVLLSVLDDGASVLAGRDGTGLARAPSNAAAVAVQGAVNIAPSLRKSQGAEVSIFVAQDFDFSGVYALATR